MIRSLPVLLIALLASSCSPQPQTATPDRDTAARAVMDLLAALDSAAAQNDVDAVLA